MSDNRIRFAGLEELKQALRNLPSDLTGEAGHIAEGWANSAVADVKAAYGGHVISGDLLNGVSVKEVSNGRFGVGLLVTSKSRLAWVFDNGSQARHYVTASGAEHPTGRMWGHSSPKHAFSGSMARNRRKMWTALKDLVTRHGLLVSGDV